MNGRNVHENGSLQDRIQRYYDELAPLLLATLTDRGDERFWREIARQFESVRALELGCGSGRVTRILARSARSVVGIDVSLEMLRQALVGAEPLKNVAFLQGDIRRLKLARKFELVVAPDDPLAHMVRGEDRNRTLDRVRTHLARWGRFFFDALWFPPKRMEAARAPKGWIKVREIETSRGLMRVEETWKCKGHDGRCRATYLYSREGEVLKKASFQGRMWSLDEVTERFEAAGLTIEEVWGDYDRRTWDRKESSKLILKAKRKETTS